MNRTHRQIVVDAGGPDAVAAITGAQPGTAKQWKRADSIPAPYWKALVDAGKATLDELADAAAARRTPAAPAEGAAA